MTPLRRRTLLSLPGALAFAATARADSPDTTVHFTGDGIPLTPAAHAKLLARLTEEKNIAPDSYSRDGIVAELEQRMAALLGKETAVFLPTGTLANHFALRLLANGRKAIVQRESHLYNDEGDCAQRLSGINLVPLETLNETAIREVVDRAESGRVAAPVGAVSIESPVRRANGETVPFDEMRRISAYARDHGIGLHLDGARMFLAAPYTGVKPAAYAALFDTVYVSLYKYFNASFGAILAGPHKLLDNLYHERRMFGGGLPHVWPQAAIALHYLDGFEDRYARAVNASEALLKTLQARRVPNGSNIAYVTLPGNDPAALQARLRQAGLFTGLPKSIAPGKLELALNINETILRRPSGELARAFQSEA
jgi:threonine aldolase